MPSPMTKSQVIRFTKACEDQGIGVTATKKGLFLRFPDGTSTVQHFTNSDVRAEQNQIARFRRSGMVHPNDNRQNASLPSYITNGTITEKTRRRVVEVIGKLDFPEAIYSPTMAQETGWDPGSVNRALYHSGFRPGVAKTKKQGRPWFTPDSILAMKPDASVDEHVDEHVDERPEIKIDYEHFAEETFFPMVDRARKAQEAVDKIIAEVEPVAGEPDPEPVVTVRSGIVAPVVKERPELVMPIHEEPVEEITFLDDRNSWAVDLDEVLGEHLGRMVRERLSVLSAVGIEYEMRCWRA